MAKTNKFVTIEGLDGCGKSTQAKLLVGYLSEIFGTENVVHTFEPGGAGKTFREILLGGNLSEKSELLLFLIDRLEHVRNVIRPSLDDGKWVVCERYCDSTLAYQAYGRGLDRAEMEKFFAWCEFPKPDLTILLDVPVEIAVERIKSRGGRKDNFEAAGIEFMRRLAFGYGELANENKERIIKIDASRDVAKVAEEVRRTVDGKFELQS